MPNNIAIHHHSQHRPGRKGPDSPAKLRGGRGAGAPAGGGAAGSRYGAEVQRNTSASDPGRAPGGGPLGAVLFLFTEPGPKDRDQPGQGAAQAIRTIGDTVEGERQSKDE